MAIFLGEDVGQIQLQYLVDINEIVTLLPRALEVAYEYFQEIGRVVDFNDPDFLREMLTLLKEIYDAFVNES